MKTALLALDEALATAVALARDSALLKDILGADRLEILTGQAERVMSCPSAGCVNSAQRAVFGRRERHEAPNCAT